MVGKGTINLYAGGERTYLGNKASKVYHPDWSLFSGALHIYPYKDVEQGAGFYGLIWQSGKTFTPDNAAQNAADGNINGTLAGTHVVLHNGATMACESGKRGLRIAHLDTEDGSTLYGYLKATANNDGYYMVGNDNTDGTLAGRIIPFGGSNLAVKVGLVKEGTGTYRITGNENLITGSVRVLQGTVMVNNDAMTWRSGKNPLLYDSSLNPKSAYYGVHAGVREVAQATGIDYAQTDNATDTKTVSETYYNLQGQRMASPVTDGIYIVSRKMSDGSVVNVKIKK